MTITPRKFVEEFGSAALSGNAAVFVGAGLSRAVGLPDWGQLLADLRVQAAIPESVTDSALAAEYIAASRIVGRDALHASVLSQLSGDRALGPGPVHGVLARLPVNDFWTTNYDRLLELASPKAQVIVHDDQVRNITGSGRRIVKLHGSIEGSQARWASPPILTRSEFERYEDDHPRMWALLRATYLSRSMLFLGFSFEDPNVEILQRLARRHGTSTGDRHFTVMRAPTPDSPSEVRRLHELKVDDLQRSGVQVCQITEYEQLLPLMSALARRTRPARVFVSGSRQSDPDGEQFERWCEQMAAEITERSWQLASLGGGAGWQVSKAVATARLSTGTYSPQDLVFHFRARDAAAPILEQRLGTAVYSMFERVPLVRSVLADCRALLAIGGGERTAEEMEAARRTGVGVVPLAASGGAAHEYWSSRRQQKKMYLGTRAVKPATWEQLNDSQPIVAIKAAIRLLRQAMFDQD